MTTPEPQGMSAAPQNGMGTAALVLGILGIIGCIPLIGGILGIIFGRKGMALADQGLATNGGAAKAGYILGIIAVVLAAVGIILWIILVAVGVASSNM